MSGEKRKGIEWGFNIFLAGLIAVAMCGCWWIVYGKPAGGGMWACWFIACMISHTLYDIRRDRALKAGGPA